MLIMVVVALRAAFLQSAAAKADDDVDAALRASSHVMSMLRCKTYINALREAVIPRCGAGRTDTTGCCSTSARSLEQQARIRGRCRCYTSFQCCLLVLIHAVFGSVNA